MINRARAELITARNATTMDVTTLANVAEVLAERMSNILSIQERMDAAAKGGHAGNLQADSNGGGSTLSGDSIASAKKSSRSYDTF